MVFIDLEKAYDRVPRQEVWRCMGKTGVSEKHVRIVKVTGYVGRSENPGKDKIPVNVGLHQGSSLIPYLFAMIMDVSACRIKDKGACYMRMILYCVAPEKRKWKRN